ncbi:DUF4159 domain-containing protein [Candidatus Latescibacterota bacterium]
MKLIKTTSIVICLIAVLLSYSRLTVSEEIFEISRLKYDGGGDWYSNPTSLPNLMRFIREQTDIPTSDEQEVVSISGEELFHYPVVYMNGHGNVLFSQKEASLLRRYLLGGGFLIADDNYGMDESFRREMKKVFPDKEMVLLPKDHPVFTIYFSLPDGIPKIHEHDGEPAQAYAIFHEGRMVVFYSFQSDMGDGWEDPSVHNDPEDKRLAALKMGTNIIVWALTQ